MLRDRAHMLGLGPHGQNSSGYARMNGFHAAIQHLGKLGDFGNFAQRLDAGVFESPKRSAGRKHFDAERGEGAGEIHDPAFVGDADQRTLDMRHELSILTCDRAQECGMLDLMRLVTFQAPSASPQAGIVMPDGRISGLGQDMLSVIAAAQPPSAAGVSYALADVKLLAPIPRPPKLICVGLNYRDHAREAGMVIPTVPTIFNKFTNVVIGPGATIVLPKVSTSPTMKRNSLSSSEPADEIFPLPTLSIMYSATPS